MTETTEPAGDMAGFLDQLVDERRRVCESFQKQASRLRRAAKLLAEARDKGGRVLVVGEPPLEHVAHLLAAEYLQGLPAVAVPAAEGQPTGDDALLLLADRAGPTVERLLGARVVAIAGVEGWKKLRMHVRAAISVPARGAKTTLEASFVAARLLARIVRSVPPPAPPPPEAATTVVAFEDSPPEEVAPAPSREVGWVRFGRGAFPEEGPRHRIVEPLPAGIVFVLDPEDEAGATIDVGDELWLRVEREDVTCVRGVVRAVGTDGRVEVAYRG